MSDLDDTKCQAVTKKGAQCRRPRACGDLCKQHYKIKNAQPAPKSAPASPRKNKTELVEVPEIDDNKWEELLSSSSLDLENTIAKKGQTCAICIENFKEGEISVIFKGNEHDTSYGCSEHDPFHKSCITEMLKHSKKCPLCGYNAGMAVGNMPCGKLEIVKHPLNSYQYPPIQGHDDCGVITLNYSIYPKKPQTFVHPNPGKKIKGDQRMIILPDNYMGNECLRLLKIVFSQRLMFTVSDSLTDLSRTNAICWSSIPAKTAYRGTHGWQQDHGLDVTYYHRLKESCKNFGIS